MTSVLPGLRKNTKDACIAPADHALKSDRAYYNCQAYKYSENESNVKAMHKVQSYVKLIQPLASSATENAVDGSNTTKPFAS